MEVPRALSLKQPWAALLVHGIKTIEVRKWSIKFKDGEPPRRVIIHAAKVPDRRAHLDIPEEIKETVKLKGGIVGYGDIVECKCYKSLDDFKDDQPHHKNEPEWFTPPKLFGFVFTNVTRVTFLPTPGQVRFFKVKRDLDPSALEMPKEVSRRFDRRPGARSGSSASQE